MPLHKIEQAGGNTAIWGSAIAILGELLGWVSNNATMCGLLIAFGGLLIQAIAAAHNRSLRNSEEERKKLQAERDEEEHQLRIKLLMVEISKQSPVDSSYFPETTK